MVGIPTTDPGTPSTPMRIALGILQFAFACAGLCVPLLFTVPFLEHVMLPWLDG